MKRKTKVYHENDLAPWFLEDHATLPESYKKSCEKFFRELGEKRGKLQATSVKRSNLFIEMLNKKG